MLVTYPHGPYGYSFGERVNFSAYVKNSDIKHCKKLLKTMDLQELLSSSDENGLTPLHLAVAGGYTDLVEMLLGKCPDLCESFDKSGRSPFHLAVIEKKVEICEKFVEIISMDNVLLATQNEGYTALHLAVLCNCIPIIALLLNDCPLLVGSVDKQGRTALHLAVVKGFREACELILKVDDKMSPFFHTYWEKDTALHLAVKGDQTQERVATITLLLEKCPILVQKVDAHGQTALHWAASKNLPEVCERLVEKMTPEEVCIQMRDRKQTALHFAVQGGDTYIEVVELLLDKIWNSPLDEHNKVELVSKADKNGLTILHWAVINNSKALVEVLLSREAVMRACLNAQDVHGQTALHWAASKNFVEICGMLVEKMQPADICIPMDVNGRKQTALHFAVQGGDSHIDVVNLLLGEICNPELEVGKRVALVSTADKNGWTILHWGVINNSKVLVANLLEREEVRDGCLKAQDIECKTPLQLAVDKGYDSIKDEIKRYSPPIS